MNALHRFVLSSALIAAGAVSSAPREPQRPPGTVRFLCMRQDLPTRYKRQSTGSFDPQSRAWDETPPSAVYAKRGRGYVPCEFCGNGISGPNPLRVGEAVSEGFYFKSGEPRAPEAAPLKRGAPDAGAEETWVPLIAAPKDDGKDYLACLYQSSVRDKWYRPKSLLVDIGRSAFPEGAGLVINLSHFPVYVQVGAGSRPVPVAAEGGYFYTPVAPAAKPLAVKVLATDGKTSAVAYDREHTVEPGERQIFVVSAANAPDSKLKVLVSRHALKSAPPAAAPKAVAGL